MDKDVVEWEKFQSEMKQEAEISEQIEAEDDFVNTEERHIKEIDEELQVLFLHLNLLRHRLCTRLHKRTIRPHAVATILRKLMFCFTSYYRCEEC